MRNPAATAMELAALAAGLVVGVAFTRRQHALADPLLDLGLFANRSFSITLGSMLAYSMLPGGTGGSRPEHVAVVGEAHQRRLPCGQG